ncbi:hypothetical protein ACVWZ9_000743 [Pseudomonas chlororaphis]
MEMILIKPNNLLNKSNLIGFCKKTRDTRIFYLIGITPFVIAYYTSVFYPGYLTSDSLYMLAQGAGLQPLSNWHPPFITILWGWLFSIFESAGGIWIIQISLYIGAVLFFSTRIKSTVIAAITFATLLLYPPIFTNMAALWKDCWVISTTLVCAAFSIQAIDSKKTAPLLFCIAFFVISSLIRIDYAVVALPLLLGAILFSDNKRSTLTSKLKNKRTAYLIISSLVALFICGKIAGIKVVEKFNPWLSVAIWDIAGVESNSEQGVTIPGYRCATSDPLVFGENKRFLVNLPAYSEGTSTNKESEKYLKLWIETIISNPIAYVKHRICVAKSFFGIGTEQVHYPKPNSEMSKSSLTQSAERSSLNLKLYWFYDKNAHGPMFRYWYYIAGSIALFVFCVATKKSTIPQSIIFMSIIMAASRFLILPAADFRYGLWIVIGSIALIAISLDSLLTRRPEQTTT